MKIKIGVMGCAAIAARSVIPGILNLPEFFDLEAVASRTREKAQGFAGQFGCRALTGYEALLESCVDAVYIPLPTGLHDQWVLRALQAGKHVYAEKSIAMTAASAGRMVDLARLSGLALMEGYMFQYHRQHDVVKELLASGSIGEVRGFQGAFGIPPLPPGNFRYDNRIGGGVLMDAAGYPLRAVHFLLGNGFKVLGAALHRSPDLNCHLFGSAFLSNGSGVGAHIGFGFDNFYQCRYEIWGSKGKISAERAFTPPPDLSPPLILETPDKRRKIPVEPDNHFENALRVFADAVRPDSGGASLREQLYGQILLQSHALDQIRAFGEDGCCED